MLYFIKSLAIIAGMIWCLAGVFFLIMVLRDGIETLYREYTLQREINRTYFKYGGVQCKCKYINSKYYVVYFGYPEKEHDVPTTGILCEIYLLKWRLKDRKKKSDKSKMELIEECIKAEVEYNKYELVEILKYFDREEVING